MQLKRCRAVNWVCERGTFSFKICLQKSKLLDLGVEPPQLILFRVPPRMWLVCRLRCNVCVFCRTGVFSLTQEYGLQFILNCKKPGFHPHPKEPPLYQVSVVVLCTFSLYCYSYSHLFQSVFQSYTSKWSITFLPLHRKKMNELLLTMASTPYSRNLSTKMLSFY